MGQSRFSEVTGKGTGKWGWEERGRLTLGSLLVVIPVLLSPEALTEGEVFLTEQRCSPRLGPQQLPNDTTVSKARCELKFPPPVLALGKPFVFLAKLIAKCSSNSAVRHLILLSPMPGSDPCCPAVAPVRLSGSEAQCVLPHQARRPHSCQWCRSHVLCVSNNRRYLRKLIRPLKMLVGRQERTRHGFLAQCLCAPLIPCRRALESSVC